MRIRALLLCAFAIGLCGVFQLKAQDPQPAPAPGHWEVQVVKGTLLPPPPDPPTRFTCLNTQDTCYTNYIWVADPVQPKNGGGAVSAGIYINSQHRGYANASTKIAADYDKIIVSVVRSKETVEVSSPEEMLKYLLPPSP